MESPDKDLFQLSLNQQGKEWIRRFVQMAKWAIIFGMVSSVLIILQNLIRLIYLVPLLKNSSIVGFANQVEIFWIFFYLILFLLQLFYYGMLAKKFNIAIKSNDEIQFNIAFQQLYHFSIVALVIGMGGFLISVFEILISIKYYNIL